MEEACMGLHIVSLLLRNANFTEEKVCPGFFRNVGLDPSLGTSMLYSIVLVSIWLLLVNFHVPYF
jgi:hypothetical protein